MLLLLSAAVLAALLGLRLWRWTHFYLEARQFGLPVVLIPVSFDETWWILLRPLFRWVQDLPFGLGEWYIFTEMGWPTVDGRRTTVRLGDNFVLCSPTGNQIITCHAPAVYQTCRDVDFWIQPPAQSQLFAFFGQNVSSTQGADWKRHRKIVGAAFNERAMRQVWLETSKRANDLHLERLTLGGLRSTFDQLAMKVLAVVAFGGETELNNVSSGHQLSFMDSLGFILQNILLTLLFNSLRAPDWLLPRHLQRLKLSVAEFKLYMQELVLRELQAPTGSNNLLSAVISANENEKLQQPGHKSTLSESELYGNMFVFNLAGYETTASSMSFALPYIAAHPDVQQWLMEEVDQVYTTGAEYTEMYPKLVRCLACIYETMRLASPAPLLVRTATSTQQLPIITPNGETTVTVTPGTTVGWQTYGGHLSPRWGTDALGFNPRRFVSKGDDGVERIVEPENALFFPWIAGPRVCPGKKFSQVEFVAVVANLLSRYSLEVDSPIGETSEEARQRLLGVMDEKYFNVSTHFKQPERAAIRLISRRRG